MGWALQARKKVNKLDNLTTGKAVDALLNYETVKLFNNEQFEVGTSRLHLQPCSKAVMEACCSVLCPDDWGLGPAPQATEDQGLRCLCFRWMSTTSICPGTSRLQWPQRMWRPC